MVKLSHFLVKYRIPILISTIVLAVICTCLIPFVPINGDMTKYLPKDSQMKQGVDILAEEFPDLMSMSQSTVLVMFKDVPDDEKETLKEELATITGVDSVSFIPGDPIDDKNGYSLYTLSTTYAYSTSEMHDLTAALDSDFARYDMTYIMGSSAANALPAWIVAAALCMILVILLIMCSSWFEPILLIITIGLAVMINMGSNLLLGEVSSTTYMIASLLQLVLSMDYSIILVNRYRMELHKTLPVGGIPTLPEASTAMTHALEMSFSSISGSALTTIVGLLALVFMRFRIGADLGFVLAKGVLISCLCIFTALPGLILLFRRVLARTAKRKPVPRLDWLARFESKARYVILAVFILFVIGTFALKGNSSIGFTLTEKSAITDRFPQSSQILLVADRADTSNLAVLTDSLSENEHVRGAFSWSGTVEGEHTADELSSLIETIPELMPSVAIPENMKSMIAPALKLIFARSGAERMSIPEIVTFLQDHMSEIPILALLGGEGLKESLEQADTMLSQAESMLRSDRHELLVLMTDLPDESSETSAFLDELDAYCKEHFSESYSIVGNAPMAWEMEKTFKSELNRITLLTAIAIFLVVLITFRNLWIPALLVLMIQSSVYATMLIIHLQGYHIYYLALLMVQSILMGALIDYAILFTNHYRENRASYDVPTSLANAYRNTIPTILTSGLIIILITAVLGYAFPNPTVGMICHTLSKGALCAIILIIFILPGVLASTESRGQVH